MAIPSAPDYKLAADRRMQKARRLLKHEHAVDGRRLAAGFNLSSSRFRHLFTEATGLSPRRYRKLARLQRAELLQGSYLTVKEIMAIVGMKDASHFVRDYKARDGQTPSQTRVVSACAGPPRAADSQFSQQIAVSANTKALCIIPPRGSIPRVVRLEGAKRPRTA